MEKRALLIAGGIGLALAVVSRLATAREEDIAVQEESILDAFADVFTPDMTIREEIEAALSNPNVLAALDTISFAEGTHGDYSILFGGGRFEGFSDHPRIVVTAKLGGNEIRSSAAGKYQILKRTWDDVAPKIGASDFSPYWQDRAAVYLIRRRGALPALVEGRFYEALDLMRKEWASLPGAGYGQPEKSREALAQVYANAGGYIA